MKKCVCAVVLAITLCGCGNLPTLYERFEKVYDGSIWSSVVYDKETGVEYAYTTYGGLTLLVDTDGKPLVYEGYKK